MNTRKNNRLSEFDYSQNGAYFVTICTKDRESILSEIVGDGALDVPKIRLSSYGNIVNDEIIKSNEIYDYINIDKYVIMPNHIHMILNVLYNPKGTSRAPSLTNGINGETSREPSRTNEMVPSFVSMLKRFTNKKCGINLWHRSYYDHIIRNQADYGRVWQYIDTNPIKWELDEYYVKEK